MLNGIFHGNKSTMGNRQDKIKLQCETAEMKQHLQCETAKTEQNYLYETAGRVFKAFKCTVVESHHKTCSVLIELPHQNCSDPGVQRINFPPENYIF